MTPDRSPELSLDVRGLPEATCRAVRRRLTADDHALRAITEAQLQAEVIRLARSLGWGTTLGERKAMLAECVGYGVEPPPLDGLAYHPRYSLGSEPGWPDLTLIRARDRRLIFAELKSETKHPTPRQAEVLELLRGLTTEQMDYLDGHGFRSPVPWVQVVIWRPSDLQSGAISEALR